MGSTGFTVLANPATPLSPPAGEDIEFTVALFADRRRRFGDRDHPDHQQRSDGARRRPVGDRHARARRDSRPRSRTAATIGNACLGSFADKELTINNSGTCPLAVLGITSSSPEFLAPSVFRSAARGARRIDRVAVRFQPASFGAKAATITIVSNDPAGARTVAVSGMAPAPRLALVIANTGNFGKCLRRIASKTSR